MGSFVPLLLLVLIASWGLRSHPPPWRSAPHTLSRAPAPGPGEGAAKGVAEASAGATAAPAAEPPGKAATGEAAAQRASTGASAKGDAAPAAGDGASAKADAALAAGDGASAAEAAAEPEGGPPAGGRAVERVSLGAGAFLLVPAGLTPEGGAYDLVVHFHGVTPPLERALGASGLRAVLVDVTIGAGSGPYGTVVREGVVNLDQVVKKVERTMARRAPGFAGVRVGRVALSAWSAGYGSVLTLLASPRTAARVDAVLLADAPHAGFVDPRGRRVAGAGLAPLIAFGRRALRGETLLAITHSEIATIGYASTRESTDFLVKALGLERHWGRAAGPGRMVRTSLVDESGFSVAGYEGVDAPAHGDHLRNLDATLFPRLRRRWAEPRAPGAGPAERPAIATGAPDKQSKP